MELDNRPILDVRHDAFVDVLGGDVLSPVISRHIPGNGEIAFARHEAAHSLVHVSRVRREIRHRILADHLPDVGRRVSQDR